MLIYSAAGVANPLKIDETFRALTRSVTITEIEEATQKGLGFNIHTGKVSFTNAGEQAIIYFKNNEDKDFIIENLILGVNETGTMSDVVDCKFYRNPTGGTIVDDAVDVWAKGNRKFNSSETIGDSLAYTASGESKTLTGGENFGAIDCKKGFRSLANLNTVIGKGNSFGATVDPVTTSGSTKIYIVLVGYYK